jgi:hypothetical protein
VCVGGGDHMGGRRLRVKNLAGTVVPTFMECLSCLHIQLFIIIICNNCGKQPFSYNCCNARTEHGNDFGFAFHITLS